MVDFHNKTFFSKSSALIIQSSTRKDPSTFFKFFQKKQNGSWERPSEGEGLTSKFAMRELVFILRVLNREAKKWTTMHEFQKRATNFHLEWTASDTLKFIAQDYTIELDYGQAEILKMLLRHILEEKVIHATSSEGSPKEEHRQEPSTLIVKEEEVRTSVPKTQPEPPKKTNSEKNKTNQKAPKEKDEKERTEIKGAIERETTKALLINFGGENAQWIPKSTIHSHFSKEKGIEQKFLIDNWVLEKNNVI